MEYVCLQALLIKIVFSFPFYQAAINYYSTCPHDMIFSPATLTYRIEFCDETAMRDNAAQSIHPTGFGRETVQKHFLIDPEISATQPRYRVICLFLSFFLPLILTAIPIQHLRRDCYSKLTRSHALNVEQDPLVRSPPRYAKRSANSRISKNCDRM